MGPRDEQLEQAMALARETVRLGLGARGKAKIKVRQPLREAVVVADGREREAIERLADIVREELNVRARALRRRRRGAGQLRGQGQLPHARARCSARRCRWRREAIAALDPAHVAAALRDGGDDRHRGRRARAHALGARTCCSAMRAPEGYSVEREGAHAVALDLAIDDDLRAEGRAREIVHAVQNARKTAGLQVEDRIELALGGDRELLDAAARHRDYLAGETLAVRAATSATRAAAARRASDDSHSSWRLASCTLSIARRALSGASATADARGAPLRAGSADAALVGRAPAPAPARASSWGRRRSPS